ncbi:MAG: toll/interleukin-1 receptor domain-containing protein [Stenotrophomonas sp.]
MPIKVFISHQRADSALAQSIADRLRYRHTIETYLDVVDPVIGKNGEELAEYVRAQLSKCTQLLAVVSPATKDSWWVPWEIGIATEKEYPLATYGGNAVVPEYLWKWPVLRNDTHLDAYADASKLADRHYANKRSSLYESASAHHSSTKEFYRVLRSSIHQ